MENDIINLLLNHGTFSKKTSKPILYHTVKMAHSIHVGQKFEDYQASLSPNRWHNKHTYLSSLGMLGTTRLNSIFFFFFRSHDI